MTKKLALPLLLVFVASLILLARGISGEDSWTCVNGEWIKHGEPSAPRPTKGCGETTGTAISQMDFSETGNISKNAPGMKNGVLYFIC